MVVNKWDFKKHEYEKIEIKNYDLSCLLIENVEERLKAKIECINCRKKVIYGDTYTSRRYHNDIGLGYPVCEECYAQEWNEYRETENKI